VSYDHEMRLVLIDMRFLFGEINADDQLTPEDKKRIKEFFLQNMIAPKARANFSKAFPRRIRQSRTKVHGIANPPPFADDAWKQLFSCPPSFSYLRFQHAKHEPPQSALCFRSRLRDATAAR
jgi:hypothetical protein